MIEQKRGQRRQPLIRKQRLLTTQSTFTLSPLLIQVICYCGDTKKTPPMRCRVCRYVRHDLHTFFADPTCMESSKVGSRNFQHAVENPIFETLNGPPCVENLSECVESCSKLEENVRRAKKAKNIRAFTGSISNTLVVRDFLGYHDLCTGGRPSLFSSCLNGKEIVSASLRVGSGRIFAIIRHLTVQTCFATHPYEWSTILRPVASSYERLQGFRKSGGIDEP